MSYIGKKPSFSQVRTAELAVQRGTDITTSGTIAALNVSNISLVRLTAATILQGIVVPVSPADNGKRITIVNANSVSLTVVNESSAATAANRITTGTGRDMVITAGSSVTLFYNTGSSRWSVESSSAEFNIDRLKVTTQSVALAEDLSPTLPTSGNKAGIIEITSGTGNSLRSIAAGTSGQYITLVNKTGSLLQISNENTAATAANRILTGTNNTISLRKDASLNLCYLTDSTSTSRWQVVGGSGIVDNFTDTEPTLFVDIPPSLDLDFSSKLPTTVTFSRNSIGTYFGQDGYLKTASANIPRIEYDPATRDVKGLLIEEQRANLLTNTEGFTGGKWTIGGTLTVVKNALGAPDGSNTACKIIPGNGSTSHYLYASNVSVTSTDSHTWSVFLKAGELPRAELVFDDDALGSVGVKVNLQTKTIISYAAFGTGMTAYEPTLLDVGDGWVRVSIGGLSTAGTTTRDALIYPVDVSGSVSFSGDGKSGIYVWGPQFEVGTFPTSYIPSADTFLGRSLFTDIAYASKSYAPTQVGGQLSGLTFKPDGTAMYLSDGLDAVYQYALSVAWDVSTATYASKSFTEAVSGTTYGIRFNNDGTKAFRVYDNGGASVVREYTLSVAYDISTMTYASVSYSLAAAITNPVGLEFSVDGLFMYVSDNTTNNIYRYALGSAWSLSSVTLNSQLDINTQDNTVTGIAFDSTGQTLLMAGTSNDDIFVYTLGAAWDITTANFVRSFDIGAQDGNGGAIYLRPDNSNIYLAGMINATQDTVYQYNCALASNISSYYDSTGTLVKSTDFLLARNTYNPSPDKLHLSPKLLLEPEATNNFLQSEDFSTTWVTENSTVSSASIVKPDGTSTASNILISSTTSSGNFGAIQLFSATAGIAFTVSFYVKRGTYAGIFAIRNLTQPGTVYFTPETKTITRDSGTDVSGSIQELPNGWYRLSATFLPTSTQSLSIRLRCDASTAVGQTAYFWGAQLEQGYAPTSYIPTTAAVVTRSQDSYSSVAVTRLRDDASMTGSNFSGWYRWDEGTMYCEADRASTTAYSTRWHISDSSGANVIRSIGFNDDTDRLCNITLETVQQSITTLTNATTSMTKYSAAFALNNVIGYGSGVGTLLDTTCLIPTKVTTLYVGSSSGGSFTLNGHIKRLIFWPMRIDNDTLQLMTK